MKTIDRILQRWRIRKACQHINGRHRVLDIGTHDGALFNFIEYESAVGIDPKLITPGLAPADVSLVRGFFPGEISDELPFDAIVILAVLEHLDDPAQRKMAKHCYEFLNPDGLVIISTPSPFVDKILDILHFLRLIDAMGDTHEDHYGFEPMEVIPIFEEAGFQSLEHKTFQLGLNHLFVFKKS